MTSLRFDDSQHHLTCNSERARWRLLVELLSILKELSADSANCTQWCIPLLKHGYLQHILFETSTLENIFPKHQTESEINAPMTSNQQVNDIFGFHLLCQRRAVQLLVQVQF